MEKILARRFAPFNFSAIPGFPNVAPSLNEWGDYLPIFGKCEEDNPAQHLSEFHELMRQWEIHHEDVLLKMFMFSLAGDARKWYHSLPPASISSLSEFHAAFIAYCQEFYPSELICHNCGEGYHNSVQNEAISDIGCEDNPDDLDQKSFLSPPHSSASEECYGSDEDPREEEDTLSELREQVKYLSVQLERLKSEDCAEDFPAWEEEDDLSELVEQAIFPTPQCAKLESEDSEEDFPVFEADDLSSSFEEIIEDFLDALASAPDEPAVSDLNEEAIVEEDCSFFLHEISHDVFTFGIEEKDRETVPISQDGGVHGKEEEEPEERLSAHFFFYPEPVSEQPPPEISEPTTVVHSPVLVRDIQPHENNCVAEEAACRQFSEICHSFYDPVSEYMEWHFPYALEPPYFISTPACKEELKNVTVLLSRLHHLLMIIDRRKELLSRKLLEWLWWKSAFT
jgi:hypothetical protein